MAPRIYRKIILYFDICGETRIERYKPPKGECYTQRQISSMLTRITKLMRLKGEVSFKVLGKGIYEFKVR